MDDQDTIITSDTDTLSPASKRLKTEHKDSIRQAITRARLSASAIAIARRSGNSELMQFVPNAPARNAIIFQPGVSQFMSKHQVDEKTRKRVNYLLSQKKDTNNPDKYLEDDLNAIFAGDELHTPSSSSSAQHEQIASDQVPQLPPTYMKYKRTVAKASSLSGSVQPTL
jgi:hypothetical protein